MGYNYFSNISFLENLLFSTNTLMQKLDKHLIIYIKVTIKWLDILK